MFGSINYESVVTMMVFINKKKIPIILSVCFTILMLFGQHLVNLRNDEYDRKFINKQITEEPETITIKLGSSFGRGGYAPYRYSGILNGTGILSYGNYNFYVKQGTTVVLSIRLFDYDQYLIDNELIRNTYIAEFEYLVSELTTDKIVLWRNN